MKAVAHRRMPRACRTRLALEELEPRLVPSVFPPGFEESVVVNGLAIPTAQTFTPDGRLFIAEKGTVPPGSVDNIAFGNVRVFSNGALLSTPLLSVPVDNYSERGLDGIVLDPDFSQNGYLYVYYTRPDPTNPNVQGNAAVNRLSRFTISSGNPNVADPASEVVLLDNIPAINGFHNGGALEFGADGRLFLGIGDLGFPSNAQNLTTFSGKILRLDPSNLANLAPADNPFYDAGDGITVKDYIWAYGFRNPYTAAIQPGTNTLFVNDVGQQTWEEVNNVFPGLNYGWPNAEGPSTNSAYTNPIYAYNHDGAGAAVTGGAFYTGSQFPSQYQGTYFFADYVQGVIRNLDPSNNNAVAEFATDVPTPNDLDVGPDGKLYYLSIYSGSVYMISFTGVPNRAPSAVATATPTSGHAPLTVNFDGQGSTDPDGDPLVYTWDFGDGSSGAGPNVSHTYNTNGTYVASLTVTDRPDGTGFSSTSAPISITVGNTAPTPTINLPADGSLYSAGDIISFAGSASDPEDGTLPASAFHWSVIFGHNTHIHPFIDAIDGVTSGSFQIPTIGETAADVYYRIGLAVTDSGGLQGQTYVDILPRTSTFTLASNVPGLVLNLDDQPTTAPTSVVGVVGIVRTLDAPLLQQLNGTNYQFVSWSDGGAARHTISTPAANTTYTATYVGVPTAAATASTTSGPLPLVVNFSGQGSTDPAGSTLTYTWNFGDGTQGTGVNVSHTYTTAGIYAARLTVTNPSNLSNTTAPIFISPAGRVFLSDLPWTSATNGYGPVERDRSNGGKQAGDGRTLTLNGTTYAKGLGVHANSEIHYNLGGAYTAFTADVGVDDEVGSLGSVVFQVWADGVKLYDSGVMTGSSLTQSINIGVAGRDELVLIVRNAGDNSNHDHADWAGARLVTTSSTYLSDLSWTSASNGYGPVERDQSNGENAAGDGHRITLNGTTYAKGLGVHADSTVRFNLGGAYSRFLADVGVDDEVGKNGAVGFEVWADGVQLYDSGMLRGSSATRNINVSVAGRNELVLIVNNGGDGYNADHGDWANARLVVSSPMYLSDLRWTSATNGYGPVERDRSNGENKAGDGRTLTLNGRTYGKGLGVHANSEIHYSLGGAYTAFTADVGIDDEVGGFGSVVFQVWGDGTKLYDSGVMTGSSPTQSINVGVAGINELVLIVRNAGDNSNYDHADWANARLLPTSSTYLSDLSWISASNGYGPVERDQSNGENLAGDGRTLTLNGTTHARGLGVHGVSEIRYSLAGAYTAFTADVGIDDEVGDFGSVVFQVWADGIKLYDSGVMTGSSPTQSIDVDIFGIDELVLIVGNAGDNSNYDHADWANAQLIFAGT